VFGPDPQQGVKTVPVPQNSTEIKNKKSVKSGQRFLDQIFAAILCYAMKVNVMNFKNDLKHIKVKFFNAC
jgi:hypothetical protein